MNPFVYRPGTWQVVAERTGVVAVPGDVSHEQIAQLSRMLQAGVPQLTDVIDVLAGGSITSLGSFAIALLDDGSARFAVRGPVSVRLSADAGAETVSGEGISTWTERFLSSVGGFELQLEDAAGERAYAIGSGVVLGASVRFGAEQGGSAPEDATVLDERAADAAEQPTAALSAGPELRTLIPSELTIAPDEPIEITPDEPVESIPDELVESIPDEPVESDPVEPEIVASALANVPPAPPLPDAVGDHDGATITVAELRRQRAEAAGAADPDAPTQLLPSIEVASDSHGSARLSTGQVVPLDRIVIIGRRPRSTRASGDTMPRLVAVESPQQDISRSHLEIRPEGDSVVVIDLHTTNGSTLIRPGADPVRLHPGEHTLVLDGDVVDLGDGVTVGFEGLT